MRKSCVILATTHGQAVLHRPLQGENTHPGKPWGLDEANSGTKYGRLTLKLPIQSDTEEVLAELDQLG